MRRAALSTLLLAAALVLQLTVVNRLRLPGGPDLVLLVIVALALCGGPGTGMIAGFCAGLSLDLAPPASQLIGQYALVFCAVGYGCGKLRGTLGRSALLPLVIAAAAAAAGEVLLAGVGLALDPARVTWAAVRQVLPFSVLCDVVISSPLLFLVMLAYRWADDRPGGDLAERRQAAGLLGGAARLAGPRLRRAAPRSLRARSLRAPILRARSLRAPMLRARTQSGRAVNLRLAARRRRAGQASSAARGAQAAGGARRALPRIAFSGRSGRRGVAGWAGGSGRGSVRPDAGRPARSPGFRPAAVSRGGSAAGIRPRPRLAARPVRLHLHGARHRDGVVGGATPAAHGLGKRRRQAAEVRFRPSRRSSVWPIGGKRPGRPG